uniref:leucine-rich repeat protein n=1 Tax=Clostridium sp. OM05-9BH TaxID=2293046 RepID=UPI000FF48914
KAFANNKKLKKVTISKNITSIGKNAFAGCKKLKKITIKSTKLKSKSIGKNAFKGTAKNLVINVPKKQYKTYKKFLKKKGNKKIKIK